MDTVTSHQAYVVVSHHSPLVSLSVLLVMLVFALTHKKIFMSVLSLSSFSLRLLVYMV
jgi:hypothetical protein